MTDSTAGRRGIPDLEPPPAGNDPGALLRYAKLIHQWSQFVIADFSGVPGGWKGTVPPPTGPVGYEGTEAAGWQAVDAITPQGIVEEKGDILTHTATVPDALAVGANTRVLIADSAEATGLRWADQSELIGAGGGYARAFMFGSQPDTIFPTRAPDGGDTAPAYSFFRNPTVGSWETSSGALVTQGKMASGTDAAGQSNNIRGGSGTGTGAGGNVNLQVSLPAAASSSTLNSPVSGLNINGTNGSIVVGGLDAQSPTTSSFLGTDRAAGVSNSAGGLLVIRPGLGTGTGAGGNLDLQVAVPGTSGSSQNASQQVFLVSGTDGGMLVGGVDIIGTPGSSTWAGADRADGVTDGSGGAVVIRGGLSTGTGNEGTVKVQLAPPAASTATTQNTARDVELWDVGSLADPQTTDVTLTGNNGGTMVRKCFSELLTLSTSGTTTDTAANLLPVGSIILSVTSRVTTEISGGGVAAFSIGDGTTAARFSASAGGLTAGSTRVGLQAMQGGVATDATGPVQTAAAAVRITTDATPSAGVVRLQVWALVFSAPTS